MIWDIDNYGVEIINLTFSTNISYLVPKLFPLCEDEMKKSGNEIEFLVSFCLRYYTAAIAVWAQIKTSFHQNISKHFNVNTKTF